MAIPTESAAPLHLDDPPDEASAPNLASLVVLPLLLALTLVCGIVIGEARHPHGPEAFRPLAPCLIVAGDDLDAMTLATGGVEAPPVTAGPPAARWVPEGAEVGP